MTAIVTLFKISGSFSGVTQFVKCPRGSVWLRDALESDRDLKQFPKANHILIVGFSSATSCFKKSGLGTVELFTEGLFC